MSSVPKISTLILIFTRKKNETWPTYLKRIVRGERKQTKTISNICESQFRRRTGVTMQPVWILEEGTVCFVAAATTSHPSTQGTNHHESWRAYKTVIN